MVIIKKYLIVFVLIISAGLNGCNSVNNGEADENSGMHPEITDGFVRLVLFKNTGSFSLFYVPDTNHAVYEPLFISRTPKSSYLTLSVNGKIHRLGESNAFTSSIERYEGNPALVFRSKNLTVTQVFSPVKTPNSPNANGIQISIIAENTGNDEISLGLKFLLDTELGERKGTLPFSTNSFNITSELLIDKEAGEKYWTSQNDLVSLMGSIMNPIDTSAVIPDYVHFANWKRLYDAPWKLRPFEGRSFSFLPYSINDSAVCYFYEPVYLSGFNSRTYTIFLTTEDAVWYLDKDFIETKLYLITNPFTNSVKISILDDDGLREASRNGFIVEQVTMEKLNDIFNRFIAQEIHLEKEDLDEVEKYIKNYRN
ncbi:MAG: hypothetical protein FWB73_07270 [Treponema sp.]|nr:hypothetical protein [Treponema sp.]